MPQNAFEREFSKLIGKTVENICKTPPDDDEMYGLVFTDGTTAWIQQDPEGNGPGFLAIEEPEKKGKS